MFKLHILSLICYAVLHFLIGLLSGHRTEEARIRYLETRGVLNSSSIQGISQFLLLIQSVHLKTLNHLFPFK